jgi:hypothetical protein
MGGEHVSFCLIACPIGLASRALGFERREELFIAALCQTLPERLIEQMTP